MRPVRRILIDGRESPRPGPAPAPAVTNVTFENRIVLPGGTPIVPLGFLHNINYDVERPIRDWTSIGDDRNFMPFGPQLIRFRLDTQPFAGTTAEQINLLATALGRQVGLVVIGGPAEPTSFPGGR